MPHKRKNRCDATSKYHIERRKEYRAFKQSLICEVCKISAYDNPEGFDFHHTIPEEKEMKISKLFYRHPTKEVWEAELKKCMFVCKKCHRQLHKELRQDRA